MVVDLVGMVLIVDDDDSMREAMARLLNAAGFGCAAYTSAEALLARGVDDASACVVSDLKLPGIFGLELLAAWRERKVSSPFILITAHDAAGRREEANRCGAAAYLTNRFAAPRCSKPFEPRSNLRGRSKRNNAIRSALDLAR